MTAGAGSSAYTDPNTRLEEHARQRPGKVFIESPDQGARITFGEFEALTRRFANFLAREGVEAGGRISVLSDNAIEALVVFWGALRAGVIVNPINVEIREKHVAQILREVAPALVLWSRELPADPRELLAGASWVPFGRWDAPSPPADDLFARLRAVSDASVRMRPARGDWSCINYTSGTTDLPKGAIWTHEAYYAMSESPVERLGLTEADTILDYRHYSWSSPQILSIGPSLLAGATLVLARRFSQARFFDWVRDHGVSVAAGIPTVINMLLARPAAVTAADFPRLRFMTSSTAPLSIDKHVEFERTYGIPIVQLAGGTETGFMCGNAPDDRKLGSIGRPTLNMRVRILDDAGREVPTGEEGEMVVSGRQMASAYWQGPDRLVPIPQDGFRNGDLARRDQDGYVYITGRKKDIIIKGGVNIASLEITNCLLEHPDVADAATLGVKDDIYGEVPVGFAALRPGRGTSEAALHEHCRSRLAAFKVPAAVVVVPIVPKNANGKIDRTALALLWEKASAAEREP
ncbi:MAG TPA: class I adenylate-forming enzyme family protein [Candidatus Methylomirabilis sp.]|nr:class I adenylate-forming enzyme family protein [Candidatus Methylomirabilis sp.]